MCIAFWFASGWHFVRWSLRVPLLFTHFLTESFPFFNCSSHSPGSVNGFTAFFLFFAWGVFFFCFWRGSSSILTFQIFLCFTLVFAFTPLTSFTCNTFPPWFGIRAFRFRSLMLGMLLCSYLGFLFFLFFFLWFNFLFIS